MLKLCKNTTAVRELLPAKNLKSSFSLPLQGEAAEGGAGGFRPPRQLRTKSVRIFVKYTPPVSHRSARSFEVATIPLFVISSFLKSAFLNTRDTRCPPLPE